jgi:dihydrofolate synthase/folylpolyglutamate synthase
LTRIRSYEQAEAYLLATIGETISPHTSYKLDRMEALLAELGDPHRAYPVVHVGGTSGKGSTTTMIAAALTASGRRTGLHTKPHLRSVGERATIDGMPMSNPRLAELLDEMMPALERVTQRFGRPTYYETLLALAFLAFARASVDVAAIEVGLGGRLDGTNVVQPEVTAITSVGLDHTEVLGNTLEEIAREKAGIAKRGVPMVLAPVAPGAERAIAAVVDAAGARLVLVGDAARIEDVAIGTVMQRFTIVTQSGSYPIVTRALGAFQRQNAAVAVVTLEALGERLRPAADAIVRGLSGVVLPGRMETVGEAPVVVFDIAHNPEKASRLVEALDEAFGTRPTEFVVAIGQSKNAFEIVRALAERPGARFTFTSFDAEGRAAIDPHALETLATSLSLQSRVVADPLEALRAAQGDTAPEGLIVVTGSTFVVAALRKRWSRSDAAAASRS